MESLYDMAAFSWAANYASRQGTFAAYLDQLIKSGNSIEEVVRQAVAEGEKRRHRTHYTETSIHGHIRFRVRQARTARKKKKIPNW